MATLTNTKIKDTYKSLLKVSDNGNLEAGLQEITDGEGNASGVQLNTAGDLTASGTLAFGELKDSGENITISKFVDEADGIASNDNDTSIPTSAAVKDYVDTKVTAEDLDFAGDSGTGAVDLDSQTFTIAGTANEVVTSASGQTVTVGLPSTINVDVQGDLTGNVTGNVSGNLTGNVTGDVSGDLTGNVTATSVLADGVTATTQSSSDNSTKVATTAFVKSVVTAEDLDFAGDSGTGAVDLDSQSLSIVGTANEIVTSASGQTLTVGLPSSITVDVTGNLTGNVSGNVTGDVTGNADTATALETSRTIALSGDVVGSGSFDGSANLTLSTTIQANSVALGTDTTGDYVSNLGAGTGVTIANNTGEGSNPTIAVNYGSTANTSVEGDTLVTIQGTTNEIEVSGGAVTLGAGGTVTVGLPNDVVIAGNLTVNGTTTTVNTQTLSVKDPLIELANDNAANSVDTGFYANYSTDAGVTTKYAGLFRDAGDSDKFKLFKGLEVEPATTVDTSGTGYTKGDLVVNDLDAVTISGTLSTAAQPNVTSVGTLSSLAVSGDLTVDTSTLKVDSANNRVGIGTSSPSKMLELSGNNTGAAPATNVLRFTDIDSTASADQESGSIEFYTSDSSNAGVGSAIKGLSGANGTASANLLFEVSGSERMRINNAGNVGIGTSSPAAKLAVDDSSNDLQIQIGSITAGIDPFIRFQGRNAADTSNKYADIQLDADNSVFNFFAPASGVPPIKAISIAQSGNVGIGTSSPTELLTVGTGGSSYIAIGGGGTDASGIKFLRGSTVDGLIEVNANEDLVISIDDSGTLGAENIIFKNGGVERMRITSGGFLKASNTGTYINSGGTWNELVSNSGGNVVQYMQNTHPTDAYGMLINFPNASPDNNINYFISGSDSVANRFFIYSDGDVWTSDAGTLTSDETLKNTITDATSKLHDVMSLRVRNFYWNKDYHPNKTDKKLIGFIAQEFEEVFPALVSEHKVIDEEVAEDGTVIQEAVYKKGIKEGKLIPILVKAMQEQQEIINDLKARIETLENK